MIGYSLIPIEGAGTPSLDERRSVRMGDACLLRFGLTRPVVMPGTVVTLRAERMWVRVEYALNGHYRGRMMHIPSLFEPFQLRLGDHVTFTAEHVLAIERHTL